MTRIHLGISTCPNDTFAFHGLMTHSVDWRGLAIEVELIDIQQLNDRLFAGDFDVAKTVFLHWQHFRLHHTSKLSWLLQIPKYF